MPPFGYEIDYMTFGGIYREVSLRLVPAMFLDNIFAQPRDVLSGSPSLDVDCFITGRRAGAYSLEVELRDGERRIAHTAMPLPPLQAGDPDASLDPTTIAPVYLSTETRDDKARHKITLEKLSNIELWSLDHPQLYTVHVRLLENGKPIDEDTRRIGFREAMFTDHGF